MITRRAFLKITMLTPFIFKGAPERLYAKTEPPLKEASYYHRIDEKKMIVACQLCPRECVIAEGETGFCRARKNIKGTLYALGYAQPCAIHVDPIEKKPFYNYHPKSLSFSIASAGCNLRCKFCQNWQILSITRYQTAVVLLPTHTPTRQYFTNILTIRPGWREKRACAMCL